MNRVSQDPAYRRLKARLIALTGMTFYADRDEQLAEVIGGRLSELGLSSCSAYSKLLADSGEGGDEMERVVAQLTIGETYFFRDEDQHSAIRNVILPDILARKQSSKHLRIWSAGCATGCEAYSLAILLKHDFADRIAGWQVNIYATDLNRSSLTQAAVGKFRESAFRATSDEVKKACFSCEGRLWTIHPRFKQWISFQYLNLAAEEIAAPFAAGARFDLILCRNVMIYFAPEANRRLVARFDQSLEDQGWLVVGATESSMEHFDAFRAVEASGAKLYQKRAHAQTRNVAVPEPAWPRAVTVPIQPPSQRLRTPSKAFTKALAKSPAAIPQADMRGLRLLVDLGDWQSAAEYSRRLLTDDRLNPEIHFYQALIFENLGALDQSDRSLHQAIYLDRNFALAHYHLGLALKRDRQVPAATRSFSNVLTVLAHVPDEAIVTAGPGVTVAALKQLARMHLEQPAT